VLDTAGVCHWVLGPNGGPASTMDRCIGAQFVACIDDRTPGQLIGELRVGATALFACHDGERFVLLRSAAIEWVEQRASAPLASYDAIDHPPEVRERPETTELLPSPAPGPLPPPVPPPGRLPPPVPPPRRLAGFRPETVAIAREFENVVDPSLPVEDIVTFSEVTVTMPLYSPASQPAEPQQHRHREALSRGQRLR
jgi:hypothetical protein